MYEKKIVLLVLAAFFFTTSRLGVDAEKLKGSAGSDCIQFLEDWCDFPKNLDYNRRLRQRKKKNQEEKKRFNCKGEKRGMNNMLFTSKHYKHNRQQNSNTQLSWQWMKFETIKASWDSLLRRVFGEKSLLINGFSLDIINQCWTGLCSREIA